VVADLASENGKALLANLRESFPEVVRIGLVNQAWLNLADLSLVHQFIRKPLDPKDLEIALRLPH